MADTARAYAYAQPQRRTETPSSPDFRVLPGRGTDLAERIGASPLFFTVLKVVVAAVLFLAVVGICRVALNAATVQTMIVSDGLTTQIAQAKSLADDLEVQETVLSNPARIKGYASENLGMAVAAQCGYIDLAKGALATDSGGRLSLAGSIDVLKASAATTGAQTTAAASQESASTSSVASETAATEVPAASADETVASEAPAEETTTEGTATEETTEDGSVSPEVQAETGSTTD